MQSLGILQGKENVEGRNKSFMEAQVCIRRYAEQQAQCMAQLNEWAADLKKKEDSSLCGSSTGKIESQEQPYSYAIPRNKILHPSSNEERANCIQECNTKDSETVSYTGESEPWEGNDTLEILKYQKRGNKFYTEGNFHEAVKCYTKCLVLNPQSDLAYSNRGMLLLYILLSLSFSPLYKIGANELIFMALLAMSFLKLKEWRNAEDDATSSLRINPWNAKSLQRRSTARASMGKLRAALQDSYLAEIAFRHHKRPCEAEATAVPREIVTAQQNIQKLLRDALHRAPTRCLSIPSRKT
jgi:tetratricopeptide (TPR) repeat protein